MTAAAAFLILGQPALAQSNRSGERIAQTYCASCHAVGRSGSSPLAEAPPFRELSRRGRLTDLLSRGMIAGLGVQEEGDWRKHPSMPQTVLDEAQVGDLLSYLRSIQLGRRGRAI